MIQPDTPAALEFLSKFSPIYATVITAIHPESGKIVGQTFKRKDRDTLGKAFIEKYNGKWNLYFNVNPVKVQVSTKANKEQIHSLAWLHVDCDPEKGKDVQEERERILKMLSEFKPKPTVILDSGGGYQAFWKLKEPVLIRDLSHAQELEGYNKELEKIFNSDHTHNVDRIMRVVGSVNIPNKKKREAGRVEALANTVEADWELAYELDKDFKKAMTSGSADVPEVSIGNLPVVDIDTLRVETKFREMIVKGEDGRYGGNRSDAVFAVSCEMVRQGYDNETIAAVLLNKEWKISEHVYNQKSAEGCAKRQIQRAREFAIAPELEQLNEQYFVACEGGKTRVFRESTNNAFNRKVLEKMSFGDFRNLYLDRVIELGEDHTGKKIKAKLGAWWLQVKGRRGFEHITFDPGGNVPTNTYNLWQGFSCDEKEGDWGLLKDHIMDNICSGNIEYYTYLVHWMAYAVQKPNENGQVAVVLKGDLGTGKSLFARAFGSLFGQHFVHIANAKHLIGSFNAHLRDCVVLFADEAFWAGDKQGEGILKMLVTERELMIEGKGQDAVLCKSYLHMLIASNHEWVVPANKGERRYFAMEVSSNRQRDNKYFKKVQEQFDNGGREAMLYELMNMDLNGFEVRDFPETDFLQEQKTLTAAPEEDFVHHILQMGHFTDVYEEWDKPVPIEALYIEYIEYAKEAGINRRLSRISFGRFLVNFFKKLPAGSIPFRRVRRQVRALASVTEGGGGIYVKKRVWCYEFPPLSVCRDVWDKRQGGKSLGWDKIEIKIGPDENDEKQVEFGDEM